MNREMRRHPKNPFLPFDQFSRTRIPERKIGRKAKSKGFRNGRNGRREM